MLLALAIFYTTFSYLFMLGVLQQNRIEWKGWFFSPITFPILLGIILGFYANKNKFY